MGALSTRTRRRGGSSPVSVRAIRLVAPRRTGRRRRSSPVPIRAAPTASAHPAVRAIPARRRRRVRHIWARWSRSLVMSRPEDLGQSGPGFFDAGDLRLVTHCSWPLRVSVRTRTVRQWCVTASSTAGVGRLVLWPASRNPVNRGVRRVRLAGMYRALHGGDDASSGKWLATGARFRLSAGPGTPRAVRRGSRPHEG